MPQLIADMNDRQLRERIQRRLGELRGKYRIEVTKYRKRRSDRQNRFYWPCVVAPFGEFLREQGEDTTDLEAHEMLKSKFLRKTMIHKTTGEALDYTRSTTELTTTEFNEYVERCAAWLVGMFDVHVQDPLPHRIED